MFVGFTGTGIAPAQLSFAGGGGGVAIQMLKVEVCPGVEVQEYTLT